MDLASTKGGIEFRQEASTGQTPAVPVAVSGDRGNKKAKEARAISPCLQSWLNYTGYAASFLRLPVDGFSCSVSALTSGLRPQRWKLESFITGLVTWTVTPLISFE